MPHYTVVARSRSSAVFYPGNALRTDCTLPDGRVLELVFRTNYIPGFSVPAPTTFYVEANGQAASLDEASVWFHQAALEVTTMIAFAVNADLGLLEVELAFDSSPDSNEHPFVQTFIPNPAPAHIPGRPIDPDLVRDFLSACDHHAQRERIQRSISQYVEALKRWNSGHGLICLAHLYMGAEALTKALLRQHLEIVGLDEDGLARGWKIDKKQLDSEIRRRFIFDGDGETLKIAREVSDGFEHGFRNYSDMQAPAAEVVVKVARYLRTAIVRSACGDGQLTSVVLSDPWSEPRGPMNLVKKLRGTLVGPSDKLASKDIPYPMLNWSSGIKAVTIAANGRYAFDPLDTITPQLGEGVQLRLGAFEVWDNQLVDQKTASEVNRQVKPSPVIVVSNPPRRASFWTRLAEIFGSKPRSS